ncbi:hypothetical protein J7F03_02905 [Streptomyces sp. ISL-43]|uniref:hypothetical protein n=1 Tax=Streptomyces sp. ISL-43 TaxID=2819183 RepID=UPI001BE58D37|nr:hypothetical protein [Streptomyces sp. ISL-43]MBT2446054.1 hypothetical protein [Streptomyces sp. ISL-43]
MTVTALVAAKSCGVTTSALALALASSRPSLLAECDPAGGTIRAGLFEGRVDASYGLYHLAAAERAGGDALAHTFASHLIPLDASGNRRALPGLTDPGQAAALSRTWPALAQVMRVLADEGGYDVVIDAGRIALESGNLHPVLTPAPLLHGADLVLLVVRGTKQSLSLARHIVEPLRGELAERGSGADALGLLLIEDGPARAHEVSATLRLPVLATLPFDPETAGYLTHGGQPPRSKRATLLARARTASEDFRAAASRRALQRRYPQPAAYPQLSGVLQRLNQGAGSRG